MRLKMNQLMDFSSILRYITLKMAHNSWRFFDRLRLGSVTNRTGFGLPDPGFVRGPTYVILPVTQRKMEVPATRRAHVVAPGDDHDRDQNKTPQKNI